MKECKKIYGDLTIQNVTVDQTLGGMRNIMGLFHDMSLLDPKTGISFRGYSLQEMCEFLPKA